MCLVVLNSKEVRDSLLAFVLRYKNNSNQYFSLMDRSPMEESAHLSGYFANPTWNSLSKYGPGDKIKAGVFHLITRLGDALLSFKEDGWRPKIPVGDLGIFLVEVPPQLIYEGLHMGCSKHLDYTPGLGVRYYKIIKELNPMLCHKAMNSVFYYEGFYTGNFCNSYKVLVQTPPEYAKSITIESLCKDRSLEAGVILAKIFYNSNEIFDRIEGRDIWLKTLDAHTA